MGLGESPVREEGKAVRPSSPQLRGPELNTE